MEEKKDIRYITKNIAYYKKDGKMYDLSNDREIADIGLFMHTDYATREKSYADYDPSAKKEQSRKNDSSLKVVRRLGDNTMIVQEQSSSDFILTELLSALLKAVFYVIFFPIHILHYATFGFDKKKKRK